MVSRTTIIIIVVVVVLLLGLGLGVGLYFFLRPEAVPTTTNATNSANNTTNKPNPTGTTNATNTTNTTNNTTNSTGSTGLAPKPPATPALLCSSLAIRPPQAVTTVTTTKYQTYRQSYQFTYTAPPGVMIQMITTLRDGNYTTTLGSEIPLDEVYNFYATITTGPNSTAITSIFPKTWRNEADLPNAGVQTNATTQTETYTYCTMSNLSSNIIKPGGAQFRFQTVGSGDIYLYQYAYIYSIPLPDAEIAQVTAGINAGGYIYITPANEANTDTAVYLFYTRRNNNSKMLDIIVPSDYFGTSLPNGLITTATSVNTFPFTIYTFPSGVVFRRQPLVISNQGVYDYKNLYKVYRDYVTFSAVFTNLDRLYSASVNYSVNNVNYDLMVNNLSVHGDNFALFYYYTHYAGGDTFTMVLLFPQHNRYGSGDHNVLVSGTSITGTISLIYYA